jgi:hypothetical protein
MFLNLLQNGQRKFDYICDRNNAHFEISKLKILRYKWKSKN